MCFAEARTCAFKGVLHALVLPDRSGPNGEQFGALARAVMRMESTRQLLPTTVTALLPVALSYHGTILCL